jgi:hypothetical protein
MVAVDHTEHFDSGIVRPASEHSLSQVTDDYRQPFGRTRHPYGIAGGVAFWGTHLGLDRIQMKTNVEQADAHEPPPRASVRTCRVVRTLDSLPAPVSGGGR